MTTRPRQQVVSLALWVVVAALTVVLVQRRYDSTVVGAVGNDFKIFLHSARLVAAGHSPYDARGLFVYPPMLAVLLAPFSHAATVDLWYAWTILELVALVVGVAAFVAAVAPGLPSWIPPLLFAFCAFTATHFWPLTVGMYLGQADAFVFAALMVSMLAASRRMPASRGGFVGVAGLLKAWPAAVGLAIFQRGAERWRRAAIAFVITIAFAPILTLVLGGWSGFTSFVDAVLGAGTGQHLVNHSVWGAPQLLFSDSGLARPVVVSLPLQVLVTGVLLVWVVALLVVALRTAGDAVMCTANVTFCIVLLLPTSHLAYALYCIPVLWIWTARSLRGWGLERRFMPRDVVITGGLLLWWLVLTETWPDVGSSADISSLRYCVVFAANLVACTVSVIGASAAGRGATPGRALPPRSHASVG